MGGYSWAASSGRDAPENANCAGGARSICSVPTPPAFTGIFSAAWDTGDCGNRDAVWQTRSLFGPGLWSWMLAFPWV